ncbi:unnamed protein product, partial [Musa acuminata subsp. burmannicoides]
LLPSFVYSPSTPSPWTWSWAGPLPRLAGGGGLWPIADLRCCSGAHRAGKVRDVLALIIRRLHGRRHRRLRPHPHGRHPLDLVKCNMKIDPAKYQSISSGFGVVLKEQGARGFFRGWAPTLLWYSALTACKIGFSQFFKRYYSDIAGPEYATKYQMLIYLASFTSAEVIADVSL